MATRSMKDCRFFHSFLLVLTTIFLCVAKLTGGSFVVNVTKNNNNKAIKNITNTRANENATDVAKSHPNFALGKSEGEEANKTKTQILLPVFAYLISGSLGDAERVFRLLLAIYHPRNEYLLHMEAAVSLEERRWLERSVSSHRQIAAVGNVKIVERPNLLTYKGPTMTSSYLHCLSILLRQRKDWDWFINLSASDYPLFRQDDIIHEFSKIPRDCNFIQHTSKPFLTEIRAKLLVLDPTIYNKTKEELIYLQDTREIPTAFTLFKGEAWVILSRAFSEYTIMGWDNLPRLLLMYFSNFLSSPESYFQTVACNSPHFKDTVLNTAMRHVVWEPNQQHPKYLNASDFSSLETLGIPFARKFARDSEVLDIIDRKFLKRRENHVTPGGWSRREVNRGESLRENPEEFKDLKLSKRGEKLKNFIEEIMDPSYGARCKIEQ